MLTDSMQGRVLINEVAYRLVSTLAPQELPLYVPVRDRYLADPESFARTDVTDDEVLGFGSANAVETFTHDAFPLITPILAYVHGEATHVLRNEKQAFAWASTLLSATGPQPIFDEPQLSQIVTETRSIAQREARRLRLDPSRAQVVSDFIIGKLPRAKERSADDAKR